MARIGLITFVDTVQVKPGPQTVRGSAALLADVDAAISIEDDGRLSVLKDRHGDLGRLNAPTPSRASLIRRLRARLV